MRAYKCDICGHYCDDVYHIDSDTFDIYPNDKLEYGYNSRIKTELRDMCRCCFIDIKNFIHDKYFQKLQEREESEQ